MQDYDDGAPADTQTLDGEKELNDVLIGQQECMDKDGKTNRFYYASPGQFIVINQAKRVHAGRDNGEALVECPITQAHFR